jgi:hypothetical protein
MGKDAYASFEMRSWDGKREDEPATIQKMVTS